MGLGTTWVWGWRWRMVSRGMSMETGVVFPVKFSGGQRVLMSAEMVEIREREEVIEPTQSLDVSTFLVDN